jgi:hypothetical protein
MINLSTTEMMGPNDMNRHTFISSVRDSLRPLRVFAALLLLSLASVATAAPQDYWTDTGISAGPPAGQSFAGPLLASDTEVFVGLASGAIAVYDAATGNYQRMIGAFNQINGMVLDSNGDLVVLNLSAAPFITTLQVSDGTVLSTFGTEGSDAGQIRAQALSGDRQLLGIDGDDNLYIADPADAQIKIFARDGTFIREWGEAGSLIGQFSSAIRAIAVRRNGDVYVQGGRFYRFSEDGDLLNTHSTAYDNLVLTPADLPIANNRLFPYDLDGYSSFFRDGSNDGLSFAHNGTLWHWDNALVTAYRRKYSGTDEPPAQAVRKAVPQPRVVQVAQRPGTTLLDIDYEVIDADSSTVEVRVVAWKDGGTALTDIVVPETWVEGTDANLGTGIAANTVHRLTWDTAADFAEPFGTFEIEILARDDQPPFPVHWISIPATDGLEAFEISKTPLSDGDVERLMVWDIGLGSNAQLVTGLIKKGTMLVYLNREQAYQKEFNTYLNSFGVSLVNEAQLLISQSGRYGLGSVGGLNLVKAVQEAPSKSLSPLEMVEVTGGTLPSIGNGELNLDTFFIGKYEVSIIEWGIVKDWALENGYDGLPSPSAIRLRPVASVSWYDVLKWCNALSELEGLTPVYTVNGEVYRTGEVVPDQDLTADGYRLPTEAEWEFAARGGTLSQGYEYSGSDDIDAVAWFRDNNSPHGAKPIGTKQANELGIHDMSGNIWELCWDAWSATSSDRVIRGGGWIGNANSCRVAVRYFSGPSNRNDDFGFRLARSEGPQ